MYYNKTILLAKRNIKIYFCYAYIRIVYIKR